MYRDEKSFVMQHGQRLNACYTTIQSEMKYSEAQLSVFLDILHLFRIKRLFLGRIPFAFAVGETCGRYENDMKTFGSHIVLVINFYCDKLHYCLSLQYPISHVKSN